MKSIGCIAIGVASLCVVFDVAAQQQGDMAGARAMFDRGVAAKTKGQWDVACPSFAESYRLFPLAGTMFQLADCEEKAGNISSAFNHYHQYLIEVELLPQAKIPSHAAQIKQSETALAALRDEIPTLNVAVAASAPPDIIIMRDSITLAPASLGVPMPVDPGKHLVKALTKDGRILFQQDVEIARKDAKSVNIELSIAPEVLAPPPPPARLQPIVVNSENGALRTGGYLTVGVGLAALVTGSVFGGLSLAGINDVKTAPQSTDGNAPAIQKGRMLGNFSTAGFVVGIAGVASGTTMLILDHVKRGKQNKGKENQRSQSVLVDVGPGGVSVGLQGVFQ